MKVRVRLFAAVFVLGLVGCAGTDTTPEPSDAETSEDDLRGTCASPRRYMAVLAEGDCAEVPATRGRWVPSPLFADAPPGTGACFYTWSGERYARVDRAALEEHVGFAGALTPSACGSEALEDAALIELDRVTPPGGLAGTVGCDVCGTQRDGKVWVVIPPEKVTMRQMIVPLSNGKQRGFKIEASEKARRMAVQLPPAPPGTRYVNGRVYLQ